MPYPDYTLARAFKFATRTAGHVTFNTTLPVAFDVATDITLEAEVDDVIELAVNGSWAGTGTTNYGVLDVASMVGGVAVNWWGTGVGGANYGVVAWMSANSNVDKVMGGPTWKKIVAGDLTAAGQVSMRLHGWVTTAGSKQVFSDATLPFKWCAKNIGPVDPY